MLRPGGSRALVSLSRGGADAAVVREFDLERRAFVPDGFTLPFGSVLEFTRGPGTRITGFVLNDGRVRGVRFVRVSP